MLLLSEYLKKLKEEIIPYVVWADFSSFFNCYTYLFIPVK